MQLHFGTELLRAEWPAAVACVGTFDGVHLGHEALIRTAVQRARERDLPAILVTFDRHPAAILAPEKCPKSIASVEENLAQFERLGISISVVLPFTVALSQMSAERFLKDVLVTAVRADSLVVGHDFAMGHDRQGTTAWLQARIPTEVIPPFEVEDVRVSSRAIRQAVSEGRLEQANRFLGRPFTLSGVVVGGQKLGRQLGYPTANIARSFDQVLPLDGVYVANVKTHIGEFRAAVSIGMRPAVGGTARTIEAYLIDYPGDSLYGRHIMMGLISRLREERNFDNLEALIRQIDHDVLLARSFPT